MKKFKYSTREIGHVHVFDLEGNPEMDTVQEVAWKIQKNIRRHRIQRVILNLQAVPCLDALALRRLMAACIRPQRSLIFGASRSIVSGLEETYVPKNVRVCFSEKEVAEDLGPFLLEKDENKRIASGTLASPEESVGYQMERRRSKRMHVAIPIELYLKPEGREGLATQAIATNISEGGLFAEYLDLETARALEAMESLENMPVEVRIFPSENFPEEYRVLGSITRHELRKKQLGLGIRFDDPEKTPPNLI